MHIVVVTNRPEAFRPFVAALTEKGVAASLIPTGEAALAQAKLTAPTLAVVDEALPDMPAFGLVAKLLQVDAFIHTAVATELSPEAFHEAGEGLGILTALPAQPSAQDAQSLLTTLAALA